MRHNTLTNAVKYYYLEGAHEAVASLISLVLFALGRCVSEGDGERLVCRPTSCYLLSTSVICAPPVSTAASLSIT